MSLPNLFNVPSDAKDWRAAFPVMPREWAVWSFSNMDHHRQTIRAIAAQKGINLNEYTVDPIPFFALGAWAYNHQQMHNDVNGVLGTGGFDLTTLDVEDAGQLTAWIRLHASEHQSWATILEIG